MGPSGNRQKQNEAPNSEPLAEGQGNGHSLGIVLDEKGDSSLSVQVSEKTEASIEGKVG